jgi:hypothetical protein
MPNNSSSLKSLLEKLIEHLETRIDLVRLKTIDKSSEVLSSLISGVAIAVGILLFVFIISVGLALYIGHLLGQLYYGFFILGGFFALVVILLYLFRHKWLKVPVCNMIVKMIFN